MAKLQRLEELRSTYRQAVQSILEEVEILKELPDVNRKSAFEALHRIYCIHEEMDGLDYQIPFELDVEEIEDAILEADEYSLDVQIKVRHLCRDFEFQYEDLSKQDKADIDDILQTLHLQPPTLLVDCSISDAYDNDATLNKTVTQTAAAISEDSEILVAREKLMNRRFAAMRKPKHRHRRNRHVQIILKNKRDRKTRNGTRSNSTHIHEGNIHVRCLTTLFIYISSLKLTKCMCSSVTKWKRTMSGEWIFGVQYTGG